jgi:hypothetical protein
MRVTSKSKIKIRVVHNNKLITVFSASHYTGAYNNYGAVVLISNESKDENGEYVPQFEKFTSEVINQEKTFEKAKSETLQQIKERIYLNRNELLTEFFNFDEKGTGYVDVQSWCSVLSKILNLKIEWKLLCPYLATINDDSINYNNFLSRYKIEVSE